MNIFGLIGFPLGHSFSKKYFTEKFIQLGLSDKHAYELFELENINDFPKFLAANPNIAGLNVTIPHKVGVMAFLDSLDETAERIGAVNVIKKLKNGKLKGYNSDYYGFKNSLEKFISGHKSLEALVLGNGGAAKAVMVALEDLEIPYKLVSRRKEDGAITYFKANDLIDTHKLIINCTPLGTFPNVQSFPDLDYSLINHSHLCYDLVYNPEEPMFLKKVKDQGAATINGQEMLVGQAEKAWEIWNSKE
jgi:shikimate dehydrogenase